MFHREDLLDLLFSFHLNRCLECVDLLHIVVMLELEQNLHVVTLELENGFVLIVSYDEQLVLLPLYLLLEVDIVVGSLHEANTEVSRQDDVHNVYLFNNDTIDGKLFSKLSL